MTRPPVPLLERFLMPREPAWLVGAMQNLPQGAAEFGHHVVALPDILKRLLVPASLVRGRLSVPLPPVEAVDGPPRGPPRGENGSAGKDDLQPHLKPPRRLRRAKATLFLRVGAEGAWVSQRRAGSPAMRDAGRSGLARRRLRSLTVRCDSNRPRTGTSSRVSSSYRRRLARASSSMRRSRW
jgi:hypothetical protein